MKPISPNEVVDQKKNYFPIQVLEAFNNCIVKNWNGNTSKFDQDDVIGEMIKLFETSHPITRREIFDKKFLDVEMVYRAEGWEVSYYKTSYNETGASTFTFGLTKGK